MSGITLSAPIAPGELIDKITILEIKSERIEDPAKLANVDVVDGRLTQELLQSELAPLQALGQCRVLVSGPASFNGAVREMLGASGVTADAITILEA